MHFPFEMYHTTVSVKGHPVEVAAGLPDHLSQVATQVEKLCGDAESARQNTGLCDIINAAPQTAAEAKLALPRPTLVATLAADITADTLETVAPTPSRKHPSASGAGTSPQGTEDAGFISFELPEDTVCAPPSFFFFLPSHSLLFLGPMIAHRNLARHDANVFADLCLVSANTDTFDGYHLRGSDTLRFDGHASREPRLWFSWERQCRVDIHVLLPVSGTLRDCPSGITVLL